MNRISAVIITILILYLANNTNACISEIDRFSTGVVLNNYEGVHIKRLDSIGTEGIHFYKSCMMIKPSQPPKDVLLLTPTVAPLIYNDEVSVSDISFFNDLFEMKVSYGGGCKIHEFKLYANMNLENSVPPIVQMNLSHNANDDLCKALISETTLFSLKSFEDLHYYSSPVDLHIAVPKGPNAPRTTFKTLWYPDNTCSVKYRSHYDASAMVYIEFVSIENITMENTPKKFPSIRIVTNPDVVYSRPFEFGNAITTELKWLSDNKIIGGLSEKTISKIGTAISDRQGQYWTLQDTVLNYNSFFTFNKDDNGNWAWGDSAVSIRNDCTSTFDFQLPPNVIGQTSNCFCKKTSAKNSSTNFSIKVNKGNYYINLENQSRSNGYIDLLDFKGRVLSKFSVPGNQKNIITPIPRNISNGIYHVRYNTNGFTQTGRLIISQ
jgi:hypothetical protein